MADTFQSIAAQAAVDIFDGLGESATYTANGWVPSPAIPDPIIVVIDRDSTYFGNGIDMRASSESVEILIQIADVPDPRIGDTITVASGTYRVENEAGNDGVTLTVTARRV